MTEERLMDTEEVATYLGIHARTVMKLVHNKQIKASRVGRIWKFRKSDVDEYLERTSNLANDSQD